MKTATREKWKGRWKQLKGTAKNLWGKLTNDELKKTQGNYEHMLGVLEERTGKTREELERQVKALFGPP